MANFLLIAGKILCIIFIFMVAVLMYETFKYFNGLRETDKYKPLIAWNVLTLFLVLIYLLVRLIMI